MDGQAEQSGGAFRHKWATSDVKRSERFSYFREGICEACFPCTPLEPKNAGFTASVEMARLSRGRVTKINTTPHHVLFTKPGVARLPGEVMSLALFLSGGQQTVSGGRRHSSNTNELMLLDINNMSRFEHDEKTRFNCVAATFPKTLLAAKTDDMIIPIKGPMAVSMTQCLRLLNDGFPTYGRDKMEHLFDALLAMINAHIIRDPTLIEHEGERKASVREGLYLSIRQAVEVNIANPLLSVVGTARQFGVSVRYVQKLFEIDGTTFQEFVMAERLERVRASLMDDMSSIADVAVQWGFRNMATFHRNFRQRFGDTPNQMRIRMRTDQHDGITRG